MRIGYPKNLLKLQRECDRNETIRRIEFYREELHNAIELAELARLEVEYLRYEISVLENKLKEGLNYENEN
tara:strand:- start:554 stop:766 length:213 start_codon:yes stop_codon:yes gene_type:complete